MKKLNVVADHLAAITSELETGHGLFNELVRGQSATHINNATDHLNNVLRKIDNGEGESGRPDQRSDGLRGPEVTHGWRQAQQHGAEVLHELLHPLGQRGVHAREAGEGMT